MHPPTVLTTQSATQQHKSKLSQLFTQSPFFLLGCLPSFAILLDAPLLLVLALSIPLLGYIGTKIENIFSTVKDFVISSAETAKQYLGPSAFYSISFLLLAVILYFIFSFSSFLPENLSSSSFLPDVLSSSILIKSFLLLIIIVPFYQYFRLLSAGPKSNYHSVPHLRSFPSSNSISSPISSTSRSSRAIASSLPPPNLPNILSQFPKNQHDLIRNLLTYMYSKDLGSDPKIVGLNWIIDWFHHILNTPFQHPQVFQGVFKPPSSILLFGHPGTGKTLLLEYFAHHSDKYTLFSLSSSALVSKWQGQSGRLVRLLFQVAQHFAPCIVFIDEIDSLLRSRSSNEEESVRRIKNELLTCLTQNERRNLASPPSQHILFVGATNRPQDLDKAFLRRFQDRIFVPLPNSMAIHQIIKSTLGEHYDTITPDAESRYQKIASHLQNKFFSASDVVSWCHRVAKSQLPNLLQSLVEANSPLTNLLPVKLLENNLPRTSQSRSSSSNSGFFFGSLLQQKDIDEMQDYVAQYATVRPPSHGSSQFSILSSQNINPLSTEAILQLAEPIFEPVIPNTKRAVFSLQVVNKCAQQPFQFLTPIKNNCKILHKPLTDVIQPGRKSVFLFSLDISIHTDEITFLLRNGAFSVLCYFYWAVENRPQLSVGSVKAPLRNWSFKQRPWKDSKTPSSSSLNHLCAYESLLPEKSKLISDLPTLGPYRLSIKASHNQFQVNGLFRLFQCFIEISDGEPYRIDTTS